MTIIDLRLLLAAILLLISGLAVDNFILKGINITACLFFLWVAFDRYDPPSDLLPV